MKTKNNIIIAAIVVANLFFAKYSEGQSEEYAIAKKPLPENPKMLTPSIEKSTYKTAVGLRAGGTSGLTFKQFTSENMAVEGIFGIWPFAVSATGLLEFYAPAGIEALNWYYGFGGHAAFETGRIYYTNEGDRYIYREGEVGIGVDGIIGIEYKIIPIPFAISVDLKPFVEVNTNGRTFMALDPGLGIKLVF